MSSTQKEAKAAAETMRENFWGDETPVNPVKIAESLGLKVMEADLGDRVSGALLKREDADPIIILSESDSANRKRFTCAHELGHFAKRSGESVIEYIDYRDGRSSAGDDNEEIFANEFAANLLMPESAVREARNETEPEFLLAAQFGVSADAMHWRLKNLGLA